MPLYLQKKEREKNVKTTLVDIDFNIELIRTDKINVVYILNLLKDVIKSDLDGAFLSNQINSVRKFDIARIAQGKSIVHLQADELKKIFIFYPSIQEQRKISAFIDKIDKRIEIQNKIIEDLKVLKKELCAKLFGSPLCGRIIAIEQVADIYGGFTTWRKQKSIIS